VARDCSSIANQLGGTVTLPDRDGERLDRRTVAAIAALALGIFVIANDFTALSVAVVKIESDLGTTLNRVQWVINGYTVVFAVLIVTGGRLADLYGRRRMFMVGTAIFGTFSLCGGLAPGIELLIASRVLMGVGGALMWPAVIGLVYAILPEAKAGLAGGLVIGVAGLGNAVGPLIAGLLIDALNWRWVFFVNVPVALAAMFVTHRHVAESARGDRIGLDYPGIATLSVGVILILIGLDVGTVEGFEDLAVITMMGLGILLLAGFVIVELRQGDHALVPRRVSSSRQFIAAVWSIVFMSSVFFAVLVYIPQFTQKVLGWSALEAGGGLLPLMVVFVASSFLAGPAYNRVGARAVIGTGAVCLTVGMLWLGVTIGSGYAELIPGLVVTGIGVGLFYSGITTAAVTSVDATDNSLAGGIVYMGNIAGGSLGLGLNTAIVLSASSFSDGIRYAFLVDATLGAVGTVVAIAFIHGRGTSFHPRLRRHQRAHG
jgi:EmrB/QacA subfamily drug resistance transporter